MYKTIDNGVFTCYTLVTKLNNLNKLIKENKTMTYVYINKEDAKVLKDLIIFCRRFGIEYSNTFDYTVYAYKFWCNDFANEYIRKTLKESDYI